MYVTDIFLISSTTIRRLPKGTRLKQQRLILELSNYRSWNAGAQKKLYRTYVVECFPGVAESRTKYVAI